MKIKIHRGQNQIGGSIIEISSDIARVILDIGIELDENKEIEVPQIDGLFCGKPDCDAVIISHYHSDHIGLVDHLLPNIPVYMGIEAYKVLKSAYNYRDIDINFEPILIEDVKEFIIKDIKRTLVPV